jgi:hypothetical protein
MVQVQDKEHLYGTDLRAHAPARAHACTRIKDTRARATHEGGSQHVVAVGPGEHHVCAAGLSTLLRRSSNARRAQRKFSA